MAGDTQVTEIKEKVPIHEVVGQYVQLRRAGRNFVGRCPFHKERTPSFHVSPERNSYMCFGCGEKGDIFTFIQKIDGVDFVTALKQLAERAGVELKQHSFVDEATRTESKNKEERLLEICEEATKFFESKLARRADIIEYLHARGVKDETSKEWRLGYAPASWEELSQHLTGKGFSKNDIAEAGLAAKSERKPGEVYDRFRGRIMFPLFEPGGRVIAFSGRIFEEMPAKTFRQTESSRDTSQGEVSSAKYVNSPETLLFRKSKVLYGFDRARAAIRKADCILLVEGQFDLILAHQSGLPFTVASSGTAITPEHLSLLSRLSKRLVLALDGDEAGIRAGLKSAAMALQSGFDVKIPTFESGKDPADLARENPELLKAAVRTSRTAVEFFLEVLRQGARDDRAYKLLVEQQLLPLVKVMQSPIDQAHFVKLIAQRIGVPEDTVRLSLTKVRIQNEGAPVEEEGDVAAAEELSLLPFDRAVGMLLFKSANADTVKKLEALLGTKRLESIKTRLQPEGERLLFEFEAFNQDEVVLTEALLETVERSVLEEEMKELRAKMYQGTGEDTFQLSKRLIEIKQRQQELRK
jgi:DNA primase